MSQDRGIEIYVISLRRATARRKYMYRQLKKLNFYYSIFDATDGKELNRTWIKENITPDVMDKFNDEKKQYVNEGAVACADSHRRLWEVIANRADIEAALILEDDCYIFPGSIDVVSGILSLMKESNFDFVLVHYLPKPGMILSLQNSIPIETGYRLFPLSEGTTAGAIAYMVTPLGARKMLRSQTPFIRRMADDWDFKTGGAKAGIVHPSPFETGDFFSDMERKMTVWMHLKRISYVSLIRLPFVATYLRRRRVRNAARLVNIK